MPEPPGTGTVDVMTAHRPRPRPTNTLLTADWSRVSLIAAAVAGITITVSGCDLATDTPLGVTSTTRAVAPGDPITGKVIYPDGKITVSVAPFASARNTQ